MSLTDAERQELNELRERVARIELTNKDQVNPNILLLEGALCSYEGEYYAWSVKTAGGGLVYLCEIIEQLLGWKDIATFQYHVCNEPKGFYELEENLVKTAMGEVDASFYHAYSDLTGYLWTTEKLTVGGHDLLKEIIDMAQKVDGQPYIALRVERKPD